MKIKIQQVRQGAILPKYQSEGAAAFDLHVCLDRDVYLYPGDCKILPTGFKMEFDKHYAAVILPRSGLGTKQGIVLGNLVGLCDSDYRGEYGVAVWNRNPKGYEPFKISNGDRLAQCMILPVVQAEFEVVDELSETDRGVGGFGSTKGYKE